MNGLIDTKQLTLNWTQFATVDNELSTVCGQSSQQFNPTDRADTVDCLVKELASAFYASGENNALSIHIDEVASLLVDKALTHNLSLLELRLEVTALALAFLGTYDGFENDRAAMSVTRLHVFFKNLVQQVTQKFLSKQDFSILHRLNEASPLGNETLQHALRSPLQGAMLTLDLMKEELPVTGVSLDDIEAVVESLKTVQNLLDANSNKPERSG